MIPLHKEAFKFYYLLFSILIKHELNLLIKGGLKLDWSLIGFTFKQFTKTLAMFKI